MLKGRIYLAVLDRNARRTTPKIGSSIRSLGINRTHITAGVAALLLLAGCDPTRRVADGQYLLKANSVHLEAKGANKAELEAILKQKPNRRVLGVPFYLHMYNLPDPQRIPEWRAKKDALVDRRNEKRVAKGKDPKPYRPSRAEWLRETVGEAPVILDSNLTARSADQLRLYMTREGWFQAKVRDTVEFIQHAWYQGRLHRPKANVTYTITPGPAYTIRTVRFTVDDPAIRDLVQRRAEATLLRTGDRFDDDVLDQERTRIANELRNEGYLYFTRELIQYIADTTVGGHQVDLDLRMERPLAKEHRGLTGTPEGSEYIIDKVFISTTRQVRGAIPVPADTLDEAGYRFRFQERLPYKPKALLHAVFLHPNESFRQSNATRTYRRLTGLSVFDRVDITYDTTGTFGSRKANAHISLLPGRQQSLSLEGFTTNRGGALGTTITIGYRHRNLFRTLGSIQGQIGVGLEAQQKITGGNDATTVGVGTGSVFNTISIGPEVTISFPSSIGSNRAGGGKFFITSLYNYQQRPDYTRSLNKVSLGLQWNDSRSTVMAYYPFELNSIRIPRLSSAFRDYLVVANDPVLRDSYTNHMIVGVGLGRFVVTHATPEGEDRINSFYVRGAFELAGTALRGINELFHAPITTDTAGNSFHTLLGVRYAEFVKLDADLRWRHTLHEKSSLAFRLAGGAGLPYGNLGVLPFETSFFVGGANGLRAWRARSIGPGSYSSPLVAFDRIGEMRLEGNAEYRFDLIGVVEGALFVDVGNIWNLKDDPRKPGGQFTTDFVSELAVGTGAGVRLNFDFFIVRFDLGLQTKDPSLPAGERWLFQPKDEYEARLAELQSTTLHYKPELNFNLGIGYPF